VKNIMSLQHCCPLRVWASRWEWTGWSNGLVDGGQKVKYISQFYLFATNTKLLQMNRLTLFSHSDNCMATIRCTIVLSETQLYRSLQSFFSQLVVIYLALPTRAGSPQQHMPITVGPFT
jgi:hypothetical protein